MISPCTCPPILLAAEANLTFLSMCSRSSCASCRSLLTQLFIPPAVCSVLVQHQVNYSPVNMCIKTICLLVEIFFFAFALQDCIFLFFNISFVIAVMWHISRTVEVSLTLAEIQLIMQIPTFEDEHLHLLKTQRCW